MKERRERKNTKTKWKKNSPLFFLFLLSSLPSLSKPSQEKFEVTLDEEGAEGIATVSDAADLILSKLG